MTEPAVQISALEVSRGSKAVIDRLDLRLEPGSVTGLLGPSGCGKTTLIRAIAGVQKIAGGSVTVLGSPAGSPQANLNSTEPKVSGSSALKQPQPFRPPSTPVK